MTLSHENEAERKESFRKLDLPWGDSIRASYFSDTFVYSCAPDPKESTLVIDEVQRLCTRLLKMGLYTQRVWCGRADS